jgi:hypothetical protein
MALRILYFRERIFTSLRDGNRPHRIVGLTQQGHDSGAERKVERSPTMRCGRLPSRSDVNILSLK